MRGKDEPLPLSQKGFQTWAASRNWEYTLSLNGFGLDKRRRKQTSKRGGSLSAEEIRGRLEL